MNKIKELYKDFSNNNDLGFLNWEQERDSFGEYCYNKVIEEFKEIISQLIKEDIISIQLQETINKRIQELNKDKVKPEDLFY